MPCRLRLLHFVIPVLFLTPSTFSQQKTTAPQLPVPHPDFANAVDLTKDVHLQYHEYDKAPLKFTSKAQYVLVPVVVTDNNGKAVAGLRRDDFRIQENGKDQPISSVDEVIPVATPLANTAPAKSTPGKVEASNELATEGRAPRRLQIIALDMVNTPFLDQTRARQQAIRYLSDSLDPNSLYQIVAIENNGLRVLHDFTQSSEDLITTLKEVRSRFTAGDQIDPALNTNFAAKSTLSGSSASVTPGATSVGPSGLNYTIDPKVNFDDWASAESGSSERHYAHTMAVASVDSTLTAFHQIAERISGIPGRKSLIWITGGFPFSLDPVTAAISSEVPFDVYQHVMQELSDQMIVLYPVDARGLLTSNVDASVHLTNSANALPAYTLMDTSNRQRDILDTMRTFADVTGGRAFVNTNDTTGAIRSAVQDGSHYYVLSYPVDTKNRRQGWRKIAVKVGTYHVRARQGYYLTQTTIDPLASAKFDLDSALVSPLEYTGIPLRVAVNPVSAEGKRRVNFSAIIPTAGISMETGENNHVFIEIAYIVLKADGAPATKQSKSYNLNLNQDQIKQFASLGLGLNEVLDLAPGPYILRVAVRDNLNGHVGSVQTYFRAE